MSVRIMAQVWASGPPNSTDRFVLLALADYADDTGKCWPSVAGIARKTALTDRGVRKALGRLRADGWVTVAANKAYAGCNLYHIAPLNSVHPEPRSPLNHVPPPPEHGSAPPEPRSVTPEPRSAEPSEPSRTIKEPSYSEQEPEKPKRTRKKADQDRAEVLSILSPWCAPDTAETFIAYRQAQHRAPLTPIAARRIAAQLKEIFDAGRDPNDAIGEAIERGWRTVKADWYLRGQRHGRAADARAGRPGAGMAEGFARAAASVEAAARGAESALGFFDDLGE